MSRQGPLFGEQTALTVLRARKVLFAASRPQMWRALRMGVAPSVEHVGALRHLSPSGVIDVGANRGQFSLLSCAMFPGTPIVAFEPIPGEAAVFDDVLSRWPQVTLIQEAVGATGGLGTLHLSRSLDSSSLLPIGDAQSTYFRHTEEVGTLEVAVSRLDDRPEIGDLGDAILMKIDVQGFESDVLKGASATLTHCSHVYVECSEVLLYDGQALRETVMESLVAEGFTQWRSFNPVFREGRLVQADYIFRRPNGQQSVAGANARHRVYGSDS